MVNCIKAFASVKKQDNQEEVMSEHEWIKEFPVAITVCDRDGLILEMNDAADAFFKKYGGRKLIGTNALDCHPEKAREKFESLMKSLETNVYSIEKLGVHRLIYQSPWYKDGHYAGFIELALPIPARIPHFIREG
jgi:transcriptional regulator of acetoin/glycerol metabolism